MDGRRNNGGHKTAGRKPKAKEIELIERIDSLGDPNEAIKKLYELVEERNIKAVELLLAYRFGKPKQQTDITSNGNTLSEFNLKEAISFGKTK